MFCYDLILFCSQIPMIIRQVPCWYKFFDQRVAVFNPSAQTTHCIFTGCAHPGKYITASTAKDKNRFIRF